MKYIEDTKDNIIQQYYNSSVGNMNAKLFPMSNDPLYLNIFNKAERLRLALLLLNERLNYSDQNLLEKVANDFIFCVLDYFSEDISRKDVIYKKIQFIIIKISELLDELFVKGLLSINNIQILKDALLEFKKALQKLQDELADKLKLTESDFLSISSESLKNILKSAAANEFIEDMSLQDVEDTKSRGHGIEDMGLESDKNPVNSIVKKDESAASSGDKSKNKITERSLNTMKISKSRRMQILDILQIYGELNASKIKEHLKKWSHKTVQRELTAMVKDGTLKKTGSGRWTKYSINLS